MSLRSAINSTVSLWLSQVALCETAKARDFGNTAATLWGYMGKSVDSTPPSHLEDWDEHYHWKHPHTLNKAREYEGLMSPHILSQSPNRLVLPRRMPDLPPGIAKLQPGLAQAWTMAHSDEQLGAFLLTWFLNYLSTEIYNLEHESRLAIREALVKGRGVVWRELVDMPHGRRGKDVPAFRMPGSYYDTVDNLLIDADARSLREAGYIIRVRWTSKWHLAEMFGIDVGDIRSPATSNYAKATATATGREPAGDLAKWYEVWSRMGIGHRLPGADTELDTLRQAVEGLGDHVYLAILDGLDYPMNLPPNTSGDDDVNWFRDHLAWPIATHDDPVAPWPMTELDFASNANNPWATAPLEAGLPYLIYIDLAYNFMMARLSSNARNPWIVSDQLVEAVKDWLESGCDRGIIPVPGTPGIDLKTLITTIESPELTGDFWEVLSRLQQGFEHATGLDPLILGTQPRHADRSAAATQAREGHAATRPDDLRAAGDNFQTAIAKADGLLTRLYVDPEAIGELFGGGQNADVLASTWQARVTTNDPAKAAMEMQYTIEAGSGHRKNKQHADEMAREAAQLLLSNAFTYGQTSGNLDPYNTLVAILGQKWELSIEQVKLPNLVPSGEGTTEEGEVADAPV